MFATALISFYVFLLTSNPWTVNADTTPLRVGEDLEFVLAEKQVNFVYNFNRTADGKSPALRLVISSNNASTSHPLLVTVLQTKGVSSWTVPYIESGYTFLSVERTLCPLLNTDPDNPDGPLQVTVEVSTSSPSPIHLTLSSVFIQDFYHRLNSVASVTATPSSPAYIMFQHPPEHSQVRVRFSSMDDTSTVCAIASIQKSFCPVVELLDNPDHRGTFQTMHSQAAINVEVGYGRGLIDDPQFYIVVTVFPSDHACISMGVATTRLIALETVDNFNPDFFNKTLAKNVNITVEPTLPDWGYGVGIFVPTVVFFIFYFIALGWILFADWIRHSNHPLEQLLYDRALQLDEYYAATDLQFQNELRLAEGIKSETNPNPKAELTLSALPAAQQLPTTIPTPQASVRLDRNGFSDYEEVDHVPHTDQDSGHVQLTLPDSIDHAGHNSGSRESLRSSREDKPRRPSMLSVLFGRQYSRTVSQATTPSPHYPEYLHAPPIPSHRPRNKSTSESQQDPTSQVTTPSPHHPEDLQTFPQRPRNKSKSESQQDPTFSSNHRGNTIHSATVTPATNQVIRSISLGIPSKSSSRPHLNPSISLTSPVVDQVCLWNLGVKPEGRRGSHESRNQQGVDSPDGLGENDVFSQQASMELRVRGQGVRGQSVRVVEHSSYQSVGMKDVKEEGEETRRMDDEGSAIGGDGEVEFEDPGYLYDKEPFPVNLCMCELPEFDETERVQCQYNRLSWYLVAAIIFYAIPAYQLVITYQQLLTISGNEDVCYYNSLCSHPWRISETLTLTAFNNIYSNIGYLVLGFLFIIIAYRRRQVYYAVEKVVNNPFITSRRDRVGVPQHFGVYYAIGLSLMAEGLMSVAYHICPGKTNYQFDTTFMFVLVGLGIFKLLESRNPDLHPKLHQLLVVLGALIIMVVVGVLYASSPWFYPIFAITHVIGTFFVTVKTYYRWQVHVFDRQCLKKFFNHLISKPYWPPKQKPKFICAVVSNLINWIFALLAVVVRPVDFGTFFLFVFLANFILLLFYYVITKCSYKERPSFRPFVYFVSSIVFWICGFVFYNRAVTNWLESPAVSRDGNRDCMLVFYDSHDMWHFMSAFALFFSFLMLMTLDDDTEGTPRTELRVF